MIYNIKMELGKNFTVCTEILNLMLNIINFTLSDAGYFLILISILALFWTTVNFVETIVLLKAFLSALLAEMRPVFGPGLIFPT